VGTLPSSPTVVPGAVGQKRRHRHRFQVGRRGMPLGTGAAIAGVALASPGLVSAESDHNEDLSNPKPRPLPKPIPGVLAAPPFDFHAFGPGPTRITLPLPGGPLQGVNVDHSVIADFFQDSHKVATFRRPRPAIRQYSLAGSHLPLLGDVFQAESSGSVSGQTGT